MTMHDSMHRVGFHCAWPLMFLLVLGCQTPPARPSGCTPRSFTAKRSHVLTRQILCDTAEEIVHHPLRAGRTMVADEAGWLASSCRSLVGKRLAMRLHGAPCTPPFGETSLDPELIETDLHPAAVELYRDGGEALAVLERMIDSAEHNIDVLMYIWEDDEVGWATARHLAARAAPTRPVRILVDGGANLIFTPTPTNETPSPTGSTRPQQKPPKPVITTGEANRVVCWLAQQPHVELIRIRNPFAHFDHRKLVLIDGWNAWAGGRNFSHPAFFVRHDVTYTLQGPLAVQMQQCFEMYWRDQGGKPSCLEPGSPPIAANAAGRLVQNSPTRHTLRHALYHAIDHARSVVWMENPYLCDSGIISKLARARRRGVDVRVVLTIQSDSEAINHTNRVTADRLLAAGVRVYLYPGRVHTKSALVDGCWAYLGSGNFDLLSLRRNHELGVVFGPGPIVTQLQLNLFERDFNPGWELRTPLPLTCKDYAYELLADFFL